VSGHSHRSQMLKCLEWPAIDVNPRSRWPCVSQVLCHGRARRDSARSHGGAVEIAFFDEGFTGEDHADEGEQAGLRLAVVEHKDVEKGACVVPVTLDCSGNLRVAWTLSTIGTRLRATGTDDEIRGRFDLQWRGTKQWHLHWSPPVLMRKTAFFCGAFHERAVRAWILFPVSIERGTACRTEQFRTWPSDMSSLGRRPAGSFCAMGVARVGVVGPTRATRLAVRRLGRRSQQRRNSVR
jgi:hypothetical protein